MVDVGDVDTWDKSIRVPKPRSRPCPRTDFDGLVADVRQSGAGMDQAQSMMASMMASMGGMPGGDDGELDMESMLETMRRSMGM
jgi:hypothetical protein